MTQNLKIETNDKLTAKQQIERIRNELKNRELIKLGLTNQTVNLLQRVEVRSFDLLLQVTVEELKKEVPGLGKKGIEEILSLVSSKGFKLVGQDQYEKKQMRKKLRREWVGLTENDRVLIKHDANFNQFMTAGEYADRVQQLTEARLKDLNT